MLSSVSPAESDGEPGHVVVDPDEADEGLEVEAEHGRQLFLGVEQDGHGDADGDDVEQLDALVDVDQPQHTTTGVAVGHLAGIYVLHLSSWHYSMT